MAQVSNEDNQKDMLSVEPSLPVKKLKRSEILLPFMYFSKKRSKDMFKESVKIEISKRYKRRSINLKKRLFINDQYDSVLCSTDIDNDFFAVINGRPLRSNMPVFKSLKESVNKVLQNKLEIGINEDCVLNIHSNYRNEMDLYEFAKSRLSEQVRYFEAFMSEDYEKSMASLIQWDELKSKIESKVVELRNLALEQFTLKSRLIGLEYQYSLQQKYGRFLYYLSPPTWRLNHRDFARSVEIEAKGFDYADSSEEDTFTVLFERLRNICYAVPITPVLYFSKPEDLISVFDFMEKQQLHYFTRGNHLAPYLKIVKSGTNNLKEIIRQDSYSVTRSIKRFQDYLSFAEEKCNYLKAKFMKTLYGTFYESVGTLDVLKLNLHLEFCYKKLFLESPANTDIITLAQSIEKFYLDYSQRLDSFQSQTVRRAMEKFVKIERQKYKRANEAAKELRSFYTLEKKLLACYDLKNNNTMIPLKRTVIKYNNNKKVKCSKDKTNKNQTKTLTEAEVDYLSLFTDWTVNDDPALFLLCLNEKENGNADKTK